MPWFSVGRTDDDEFDTLNAEQRRFVTVLRERAVTWPCDPDDTVIFRGGVDTNFAHLLAVTYPDVLAGQPSDAAFGVFFDGQGVLGGEVHNQMYILLDHRESAVQPFRASGSPARCAEHTADWFERILSGDLLVPRG